MKKNNWKDTDFLTLSARLRAAENGELTREKLMRVIDAADFAESFSLVCDLYGADESERAGGDYEALLDRKLSDAYAFADELLHSVIDVAAPPEILTAPLRYAYDAQNLKAAVKCRALDKDPALLLSDNGTVSAKQALRAASDGDFSAYPEHMASAATEAAEQLAATGDPQQVDLILDRAVFADMARAADDSGLDYLAELVKTKADSANIGAFLRCVRQNKNRLYFEKLFLPGGTLDKDFFLACYDDTPDKLLAALAFTAYSDLSGAADAAEAEKAGEELYTGKAYEAQRIPFGAELVICYLIRKEYEIKNVRIALAGKSCGLAADTIKKRLRGLAS